MPAAAVIPAPRAYTIIAAVKTPVVCHWVAGLLSGPSRRDVSAVRGVEGLRPGSAVFPVAARVGTGENPQQHVLCPLLDDGVTRSCRKPPSVEAERWLCLESRRGRILATTLGGRASKSQCPPPEPTVSDTLENSVCSKRPHTAGCPSRERQSIDRARNEELCWSWSLLRAMWCMV